MNQFEPNLRNRVLLVLLYGTGLRVSEACGLCWCDIQMANAVSQECAEGLQLRFPGPLADCARAPVLLKLGRVDLFERFDSPALAERGQMMQRVAILPPTRILQIAFRLPGLIDVAVTSEEQFDRASNLRNLAGRREPRSARKLREVFFIHAPNQIGYFLFRYLLITGSKRIADASTAMYAIDVEGATALVGANIATPRSEVLTRSKVTPVRAKSDIYFHDSNLPLFD